MDSFLRSPKAVKLAVLVVAVALTASCGPDRQQTLSDAYVIPDNASFVYQPVLDVESPVAVLARGSRDLGGALLAMEKETNPVLSPWALSRAMGQVRLGASAKAGEEIDAVFGFPTTDRDSAFSAVIASLLEHDGSTTGYSVEEPPEQVVFHAGDGIFIEKGYKIGAEYLAESMTVFNTGIYSVTFPDEAETVMNAFVAEHTGDLIEEIPMKPGPETRLTILSTNYFAASWLHAFEAKYTEERLFTRPDGSTTDAQTMQSLGLNLRYLAGDNWQAIDLPYADGFVMRLILPGEGISADSILVPETLDAIAGVTSSDIAEINLWLPRWDIRFGSNLTGGLRNLGLQAPFLDNGLPGIAPGLAISDVAQETVITVAEKGTVAAAVVQIDVGETSMLEDPGKPVDLRFDRPFIYSIVDTDTDTTLFMGRLDDPTVAE